MATTKITSDNITDGAITSAKLDTNIAVGGTLGVTGDANFDSNTLFVDASANSVGIGTANPQAKLHLLDTDDVHIQLTDSGNVAARVGANGTAMVFGVDGSNGTTERLRISSGGDVQLMGGNQMTNALAWYNTSSYELASIENVSHPSYNDSGGLLFKTAGLSNSGMAERMRIASSGDVGINTTNTGGKLNIAFDGSGTSNWGTRYFPSSTSSTIYIMDFIDYQGQRMGYITGNPSANTTLYATSSDYRLKENVDYTWDATTRLKQLKPARFNWIRDESNTLVDGFLAHEVEGIIPEAITGKKDATETKTNAVLNSYGKYIADDVTEEEWTTGKEDGTYDADTTWAASHTQDLHQGIDQSKLVPLLTKAIQEQQTLIESLTTRLETLENA